MEVAMRLGVLLLAILAAASSLAHVNVNYRLHLLAGEMCDQEARLRMAQYVKECEPVPTELLEEKVMRDKGHATMLKALIKQHGFPTISKVGNDGAHAAVVIAYHADHDRKFQKTFLKHLEAAMKKGDAHSWDFAFLFDKLRIVHGKAQCFGTHFQLVDHCKAMLSKSESTHSVNRRRAKMGMCTVAEGLKMAQDFVDAGKWHQAEIWTIGYLLADNGEKMSKVWSEKEFSALDLPSIQS
jgi:hypothetical protein